VPEPVAALLRQHLRGRSKMTTAATPASPWLFPGPLAGEHRSYRCLVRVLHQLGHPARASGLAAWRELVREAPPAVLADTLGVSAGTAMRRAPLGGADWSAYDMLLPRRSCLETVNPSIERDYPHDLRRLLNRGRPTNGAGNLPGGIDIPMLVSVGAGGARKA